MNLVGVKMWRLIFACVVYYWVLYVLMIGCAFDGRLFWAVELLAGNWGFLFILAVVWLVSRMIGENIE